MSNLFGIGLSGLSAAQSGLATTSNNISNVNTPGYTRRQTTLAETAGSGQTGGGVSVTGIARRYASFLSAQLNDASATQSATESHLDQMSQIDNLLSDSDAGLAPQMQDFFDSVAKLATAPEDSAARSAVLGDAQDMTSRFREFAHTLDNMSRTVNGRLSSAVDEVNNNAKQIASLNQKIAITEARTGAQANNLRDQRDKLVADTSKLVNADVSQDNSGRYTLTVGGQSLVDATGSHKLTLVADKDNADQMRLAAVNENGSTRVIPNDRVGGGEIGGLLSFAADSLAPTQARLNQSAHVLAAAVNEQHEKGIDLQGDAGGKLFDIATPTVKNTAGNAGNANVSATFTPGDSADVTTDNYRLTFKDGAFEVTRLDDGSKVPTRTDNQGRLTFGGLTVQVSDGKPAEGDAFVVRPLDNAADSIKVAIDDPSKLAAAGKNGGRGDNGNANALASLQQASLVEGNRSVADNYAQLVSDVGNKTQSLQVNSEAQASLTGELSQAQQSVSGVNLDEESVNLMYYQQMYQANARVIQTASSVFDTLLGLRS